MIAYQQLLLLKTLFLSSMVGVPECLIRLLVVASLDDFETSLVKNIKIAEKVYNFKDVTE